MWLGNAACCSAWVGLPQYAGQLKSVGIKAEIGFWGTLLCIVTAIALGTFTIRYLSKADPSPVR